NGASADFTTYLDEQIAALGSAIAARGSKAPARDKAQEEQERAAPASAQQAVPAQPIPSAGYGASAPSSPTAQDTGGFQPYARPYPQPYAAAPLPRKAGSLPLLAIAGLIVVLVVGALVFVVVAPALQKAAPGFFGPLLVIVGVAVVGVVLALVARAGLRYAN